MAGINKDIFNSAKEVYIYNKGSILRTIVYTIGYFLIVVLALTNAIVEPLVISA